MEDLVNAPELGALVRSAYGGKTVLVTGHNGFVGSWLSHWLLHAGATVVGLSLSDVPGSLADVTGLDHRVRSHQIDLRDGEAVRRVVGDGRPELVFHLAAQALVLPSYEDPLDTFSTNVMGTGNLLEAIRFQPSVRACVVVTSDKCYAAADRAHLESDPLGGDDPYSASKAGTELITHAYRSSFLAERGVGVATARAGNIVGGGDWGAHRLVPDCMLAAASGRALVLRHPSSVRPWQHVLDAVAGYLRLGAALIADPAGCSRSWNFGPNADAATTVGQLVHSLLGAWTALDGTRPPEPVTPTMSTPLERTSLRLDSSMARDALSWSPALDLAATVEWATAWYWPYLREPESDHRGRTIDQIEEYEKLDANRAADGPRAGSSPTAPAESAVVR